MTDVTIQLSEAAAIELADALQVPSPDPIIVPAPGKRANISATGGTVSISRNDGFLSIARVSLGLIEYTMTEAMADASYMVTASGSTGSGSPTFRTLIVSSTVFRINCFNNGALADPPSLLVKVEA